MSIKVQGLSKSYGNHQVFENLNFELPEAGRLALLGQNGAGKTTLLRILATLERPTSGTVEIAGFDGRKEAQKLRAQIGFLSHESMLYPDLTPLENLEFFGRLYGLENPQQRALELLEQVGLSHRRYDAVRTFSRGMKQRVSLARALVHDPQVVLLDEPYSGLDAPASRALEELISQGMGSRTYVMVSHNREQCLDFCTHLLWMDAPVVPCTQEEESKKRRVRKLKNQPVFCVPQDLSSEQLQALLTQEVR